MRISDWSSDVCSSDLAANSAPEPRAHPSAQHSHSPSPEHPAPAMPHPPQSARWRSAQTVPARARSEERRVGKSVSVRVDRGGCRIIKKKKKNKNNSNRKCKLINNEHTQKNRQENAR